MTISEKRLEIITGYIGIKEIPPNQGWYDKNFENEMIKVGWRKGWSWCCLLDERVTRLAYSLLYPDDFHVQEVLKSLYSPNSQRTFNNFQSHAENYNFYEISAVPFPGSTVIWKLGEMKGHTATVKEAHNGLITVIGGNQSDMVREKNELTKASKNKEILGYINWLDL